MMKTKLWSIPKTRWVAGLAAITGVVAVGVWSPTPAKGVDARTQTRKTTDPPMMSKGKMAQDLFFAIDHHDPALVANLLKQGADPNSRNGLELTPLYLAAASHQNDVVKALLKAGATVNAESNYGNALTFAAISGNAKGAEILLSKGVEVDYARTDGFTPLLMASYSGAVDIVKALVARKADVQATCGNDSTALMLAARGGHTEVGRTLLDAGAKVDAVDYDKRTALMAAAMNGHVSFVKLLLQRGAAVDAVDAHGRTALMLATAYGDYPEVVKVLLEGKADRNAKDEKGATAAAFAARRNAKNSMALLGKADNSALAAVGATPTPRQAITTSLTRIQSSMMEFGKLTKCISCHQEGLGRITTAAAKERGVRIDPEPEKLMADRVNFATGMMGPLNGGALKSPEAMRNLPLIEMNEISTGYSWWLAGMAEQKEPVDAPRTAMAMVLAQQQSPDGSWTFSLPRIPMQSSFFTFTALAVRSIKTYGDKTQSKQLDERIEKAKNWLLRAQPRSSEDRAFRLLGLKWCGASDQELKSAADAIRADQGKDGGWSQSPNLQSDAYATGQALYALHVGGGMPASDPVYRRGIDRLLRTQDSDGSWFVNKRAFPANNYFDSAFPHGESQYASFNATCWATLAILQTLDTKR